MKKFALFFALAILVGIHNPASSYDSVPQGEKQEIIQELLIRTLHQSVRASNLIDWEVGEYTTFKLSSAFGAGEMKKYVDREEGEAIWVISNVSLLGQNQKVEVKISRVTGEILEYIENGQKKAPPSNEPPEIIEQGEERITVPAGTFDTIRMKLKTKEGQNLTIWLNPSQIALEGTAQMEVQGVISIKMQLTAFGKGT